MSEPKTRTVYRLPPCQSGDVERTESWLQDMAEKGLVLEKQGIFWWGLFCFRREEPRPIQYRLFSGWQEPSLRNIWQSKNVLPPKEEKEFHASYGWEYVAQRDGFSIYAREGETGREMHTDPAVQAIDVGAVWAWTRLYLLMYVVLNALLLVLFGFESYCMIVAAATVADMVLRLGSLRRLRKRLERGEPLDHHRPWRRYARFYRGGLVLLFVLLDLCLVLQLQNPGEVRMEPYPGDPPFPTVQELVPQGEFQPKADWRNWYAEESTLLCPVKLETWEEGEVLLPDGQREAVFLYVEYYETRFPRFAEKIARDLLKEDRKGSTQSFEELPLGDLGVDASMLYSMDGRWTILLLQNGEKVLRSNLWQDSGAAIPLETWTEQMAKAIQ